MVSNDQQDTQAATRPPSIRRISGTQPGILDPTQLSRILRVQGARLSFAAFDPLTAHPQGSSDSTRLNQNSELYRPKRVVIETAPSGESTWRFVPSAKRDEGVSDEGTWPRIVEVCGQLVEMSQDQWDIYKLDLHYECLVRRPSQLTLIQPASQHLAFAQSTKLTGKRQIGSHSPPPKRSMPPPQHSLASEGESSDEEEVESMVTNGGSFRPRRKPTLGERRERLNKDREERREKIARKMEFFPPNHESHMDIYPDNPTIDECPRTPDQSRDTLEKGKRKATSVIDTSWSPDWRALEELRIRSTAYYTTTSATKRTRTMAPTTNPREFRQKKMERSRLKEQKRMAEAEARRWARDKRMLEEILENIPEPRTEDCLEDGIPNDSPTNSDEGVRPLSERPEEKNDLGVDEDESARLAAIEESRKKLAELERDLPPREEQAKQRRLREEAERQTRETQAEERLREEVRKNAEAEARARKQREDAEAQKREKEETIKRERELRDQERRQRQQGWCLGPWTTQRALERYRILAEIFDNIKYTPELPLAIEDVPWPSLQSPRIFSIEDVTWDSVERFFEAVRPHLRLQDYRLLVEKSHRRFHPDRWRSRNLLKTIEGEETRGCLEVAANTVAQAITPLWRNLTGR